MIYRSMKTMSAHKLNGSVNKRKLISHTTTGLKRWSCHAKDLPSISQTKNLHVYDFDNTLFMSPLPNQKLWDHTTIGKLHEEHAFGSGGWWHDPRFLAATGEGVEKEQSRAWKGWWNEQIVELVQLSARQDDTLTVLLTGRGERRFADLIKQIVSSRGLSFDMICLKPETGPNNQRFSSTMNFKQAILSDLVMTYKDATEIRVYEDRPKHTHAFREFLRGLNFDLQSDGGAAPRKPIAAEVIQVADQSNTLDPVIETAEVQNLVNQYNLRQPTPPRNLKINRTVHHTGYMITPSDTTRLQGLVNKLPGMSSQDIRLLANNILISYGPTHANVLEKIGGIGHAQKWRITGLGVYQNSIWAARVEPVPSNSTVYTEGLGSHFIILAQHRSSSLAQAKHIDNWQPLPQDQQFVIQSTIGEKAQLRVEAESDETDIENANPRDLKRGHSPTQGGPRSRRNGFVSGPDETRRVSGHRRPGNQTRRDRGGHNQPRSGVTRAGMSHRGGGNVGGSGNRIRGVQTSFKSPDDNGSGVSRYNAHRGEPAYDDYVPSGNGSYEAAFPAIRGAGPDAGLNYGK